MYKSEQGDGYIVDVKDASMLRGSNDENEWLAWWWTVDGWIMDNDDDDDGLLT